MTHFLRVYNFSKVVGHRGSGVAWSNTSGDTWSAGSGYTLRENETNNTTRERFALESATLAAASTTAAFFKTGTSATWAAVMATFKPATTSAALGTTTTTRYVAVDNLGGSNVVTDQTGNVVEMLDYYPYGATRINTKSGSYDSQRKWIGQISDSSGLNYLNARYENPQRGQFLSEDPIVNSLGTPDLQQLIPAYIIDTNGNVQSVSQNILLSNPQMLNSYSYAVDNPIRYKDPSGKCAGPLIEFAPQCIGFAYGVAETKASDPNATPGQLLLGGLGGVAQVTFAEERVVGSAAIGFGTSIAQDLSARQAPNIPKALVSAGSNALGVSVVRSAVSGVSTIAAQVGGSVVLTPTTRAVSSMLSGGYQTVNNINAQRAFAPVIPNSTAPTSSGGGGLIGQVVNSIKSFVGSIFK